MNGGIATPPAESAEQPSREEFCARFKAELLRIAGPQDSDGRSVAEYAEMTAPTYFDNPWMREEGPEECARADFSYWED